MNKGTLSQTLCSSVPHENVSDLMNPLMLHTNTRITLSHSTVIPCKQDKRRLWYEMITSSDNLLPHSLRIYR